MMKRWHEILLTFAVILILLLLSFGLLKLPKLYFERSDEKLDGIIHIGAYDMDNEIKPMNRAQIQEIFEKEDVLMVEEEAPVLDKELFDKLIAGSLREFLLMIFNKDMEAYPYELTTVSSVEQEIVYTGSACTILEVKNDEIYSARVGAMALEYYTQWYADNIQIEIIFNLDNYDILGLRLFDQHFAIEFQACLKNPATLEQILNEYYGTEILWEKIWLERGDIAADYLSILPLDYGVETSRVLGTLQSRMYENGYEKYGEMIQE